MKDKNKIVKHCGICIHFQIHKGFGHAGTWCECSKGIKEQDTFNEIEAVKLNKKCELFELNYGNTFYLDYRNLK